MKNKILVIFFLVLSTTKSFSENLFIEAKNISIDKKNNKTIFDKEVKITTEDKNVIKSNYVEYDKNRGMLIIKNNVIAKDIKNNIIKTNYAEYDENNKIFKTIGLSEIVTSENYIIKGQDIILDNKNEIINSLKKTTIEDQDGNQIFLNSFNYNIKTNIFKSVGYVKVQDKMRNEYEFSQIYIDTEKKEILGTDIKAFLNDESFKINEKNDPRIFSNTIKITKDKSYFNKSIFTLCQFRKNEKCPPWTIQSSKMLHDNKKKTIYYDNAVVKVYDIPIFFFPKLSHPDPTVDRRSGFLTPSFYDTKNLGEGIAIPYFFDLGKDKNFTLTSRIYATENPLMLGEYHQAFKGSNLLADFGFTEGYKNTSTTKKAGEKSHFFGKFVKNFKGENDSENNLSLSFQDVTDDKYLKLYRIKSNLVDYNEDTLESELSFTHESESIFFGLNASVYETMKGNYNDKYEYILPEITIDKNLINDEKFGTLDLQSNLKIHNYDTNKLTNFLVNDFDWSSNNFYFDSGLNTKVLGKFKNINYETKNVDIYKDHLTNEFFGALGILSEFNLQKNVNGVSHLLTPKTLIRYSPGSMRNEDNGYRLDPFNSFSLNRVDNANNFETGLSSTLGFDYKIKDKFKDFNFSVAQVINQKENSKMNDKTSLDEKLSDLVGAASLQFNKFSLDYNFSLDQNYSDLNYNEIGSKLNMGAVDVDFRYLQEKKHVGDQDYFTTKVNFKNQDKGLFSFETKRNLITSSSEFYNLSYEYINDCLRAGLVYRREFYNDSELEPENSLLFKITLTPFEGIESPTFSR